jgi:LCP family protein required for cell wall assembly
MFDSHSDDNQETVVSPSQRQSDSNQQEPSIPAVYRTSDYVQARYDSPPPPPPRDSGARDRVRKRRVQQRDNSWLWVMVAGVLFSLVLIVGVGALLIAQSSNTQEEILPTADLRSAQLPTPVVARSEFDDLDLALGENLILPDGSSIALTPWDGQSRFTMVLVGLDRRPGETGLAYRTDTMMLISIDPATNAIGVLSIPRDLYVQVPGYANLQRVNTPMVFGESQRLGYGPVLLMQTVQLNLGIRVNDYMAVDFQAFIDVIDAIGGIEVTTDYTINDRLYPDMNYGYDPFYLPAGTHQLSGYDALRFARTRHGDSDIRRAERQQQVIYAMRDKVLRLDMIPSLLLQAPALWASWEENVYTGLSLEQIIQLGLYVKDVPLENIQMGVIDYRYLQSYSTPDGQSVLIPNRARLGNLMVEVFGGTYSQ